MGKSRHRGRRIVETTTAPFGATPKSRELPPWARQAIPLTKSAEPLVVARKDEALHRHQPTPEDDYPLPRNRSLALPRSGVVWQLSQWVRSKLPKKPRPTEARRELELTRKQLKGLRRQITIMERALERMS